MASMFTGRALAAQPALIGRAIGLVWIVAGKPKVAWNVTIFDGTIAHIDMIAGPDELARLDPVALEI